MPDFNPDRLVPAPIQLIATLDSTVVGRRFHPCAIAAYQELRLRREPENPHDPNAIRVETLAGVHAGYLPRTCAAWLAAWIDGGAINPTVFVPEPAPEDARQGLPILIDIWTPDNVELVGFRPLPPPARRFGDRGYVAPRELAADVLPFVPRT